MKLDLALLLGNLQIGLAPLLPLGALVVDNLGISVVTVQREITNMGLLGRLLPCPGEIRVL